MTSRSEIIKTIDEISHSLRNLADRDQRGFACSRQSLEKMANWDLGGGELFDTLQEIRRELGDCQRCKLARGRTRIVFGSGSSNAKLIFVGEGPGFEEDQQGEPFVGPAGQLLSKIIGAIHLNRKQVYICNIVKCRPPHNRAPQSDEISTCLPFLERQIAAIRPHFICALGTVAAQTLLNATEPISRLRGRFYDYRGIKLLPTYHPAYLLRNADKKREVWEDMKLLMKEYPYET